MPARGDHAPFPPALAHLAEALTALERENLRRRRVPVYRGDRPSFCSNDYLGLAASADGFQAGLAGGAGASRLVCGESDAHEALEGAVASWLGVDGALVFSSGYAANVGVLSSVVRPGELVVSDALNHASIIDGCRLAKATVAITPHLDLDAVEGALRRTAERPAWVVTESYFGMDGDGPDLAALRALCDRHHAGLIVDEAHALGVLGPDGRGLSAEAGVRPEITIGTLGKAFGRQGAFAAGSQVVVDWLWNRARSFVFSTGLSPALAGSAHWALSHAGAHPSLRARCLRNAETLRATLRGFVTGQHHVIPILIGEPGRAMACAAAARANGVHVQAIRPPTVPAGTARLRVTTSAQHTDDDVAHAGAVLGELLPRFT